MQRGLRTEIRRIVLFAAFCTLIGWLLGEVAWCLIIGGTLYSVFLLRQMQRFYLWLTDSNDSHPPQSSGIWGDIFDALYRMRKTQAQQQASLMEQLTRMQDSTAALRDGVVLLDKHCAIAFWNDAAGKLLGLRRQVDEQQIFTNLFRDLSFARYYQQATYLEPLTLPSPLTSNDWLEIQINEFGDHEKLMVIRDVTRLRQLEKIRSDFVANVSHELRTPLTVLKGYVETLQEQHEQLDPRWGKALIHMQQQTQRMENLIDDLTLLSRLENRNAETEHRPVNIESLANRLLSDAQQLSSLHRVELSGTALTIPGNEIELYSAFSNLVTNALRYSPANTTIQLRWGTDQEGTFFSVTDQGPGISSMHIPRLTERFYRIDAGRSRADGGTGLGLAIVKHALARNGGVLEIMSTLGKGSTFTCHFPHAVLEKPFHTPN